MIVYQLKDTFKNQQIIERRNTEKEASLNRSVANYSVLRPSDVKNSMATKTTLNELDQAFKENDGQGLIEYQEIKSESGLTIEEDESGHERRSDSFVTDNVIEALERYKGSYLLVEGKSEKAEDAWSASNGFGAANKDNGSSKVHESQNSSQFKLLMGNKQ